MQIQPQKTVKFQNGGQATIQQLKTDGKTQKFC